MMQTLLKEVARGKRGARDLSYDESVLAVQALIDGSATPVQAGAFLIAERIKMESTEEIRAFVDTLRSYSRLRSEAHSLDCAGPYDGRSRSFWASFPTAFVLSACQVPVTLHGSPTLPPKYGITLYDMMLELLSRKMNPSRSRSFRSSFTAPVQVISTETACPPLAKLRPLREELGMRTVFNTAEKLLRLTDSPYMAVGVFHGTVFEKMAEILHRLGIGKGIIVQGMEGSEDLPVNKRTRTLLVHDGQSELMIIDPELYELQADTPEEQWTAALQIDTALKVLQGEPVPQAYTNMVLLNSGVRLWLVGKTGSIEEGVYTAKHTLDHGLAWKAFESWRQNLVFPA